MVPIDIDVPRSPGWWLDRLAKKLNGRQKRLQELNDRYEGNAPLPIVPHTAPKAAETFFKKTRLNMAELVVGSMLERMQVRAIHTAQSGGAQDGLAWRIWRNNGLEVEFADVLESMLVMGDGYMIVRRDENEDPAVVITGEDPRNVVTIHDPVRQSRIRAGAKFYHDPEMEQEVAYLYIAGEGGKDARVYRATKERKGTKRVRFSASSWDWDGEAGGDAGRPIPGTQGRVPLVRFRNKRGVGEFETHTDVLDRIDHMILQRMVIATMQAFKQRAIKGDLPTHYPEGHPHAGEEIDYDGMFEADPGALWMIPAAAEVWESGQVDLTGILNAVKDDIKNLAAVTRRPISILAPDGENQSATGAQLTREGLVFGAEDREARAGQALAQVMHLSFLAIEDAERAALDEISVEWRPVERFTLAEKAAAAQQAKQAGMSKRWILEHCWQATPEQVRDEEDRALDELMLALAQPGQSGPPQLAPAAAVGASTDPGE